MLSISIKRLSLDKPFNKFDAILWL